MSEKTMRGSLEDLAWQHLVLAQEYGALVRWFESQNEEKRRDDCRRFHDRHYGAFEELTKDDTALFKRLMLDLEERGELRRVMWQETRNSWR